MALFGKPKYSTVQVKKKDIPKGLWTKCPKTNKIIYIKELEDNWMVVPGSGYHFQLPAQRRVELLIDNGTFKEMDETLTSKDPLNFKGKGSDSYLDKIKVYQDKTGLKDSVYSGIGKMNGIDVSIAVMDFRFQGASMGSVAGEKITRAVERGIENNTPVIVVSASGGARMQEGILSLMQMGKTSAALARLAEKGLPYISVLTNPTMAGVMASYASLGDVIIAEPGALIGFAGARVIKETTNQDLPDGFQTSEFLLAHGLLDQIVDRSEMKERITHFIRAFTANRSNKKAS
jgi:acetyl-CoA carboxylase carboxyl transferase subunit beta